jgi:hypothetical protein
MSHDNPIGWMMAGAFVAYLVYLYLKWQKEKFEQRAREHGARLRKKELDAMFKRDDG